ncbi:aldehyde dehydrogenase family protein [Roseivirga sp. BDSF3-8]|uniref:aldehyde dehydrogenase family protein n=1 Tax=Roseivirga sp. BDSF3-8 TaxID=3241598 RepID=UPI0035322468
MPEATLNNSSTATDNVVDKHFRRLKSNSVALRSEGYKSRKRRLTKLRDWVMNNRPAIKEALFKDFKKPPEEVDLSEVYVVIQELNHAITHLKKWMKPKKVSTPLSLLGTNGAIHYEPKGICLIIAPWNFPFNLTVGPLVSALAAGNTVMIKPSELSPATSDLIHRMVEECFGDDDIVQVMLGDKETSTALLERPFDHIFFTGSPQVGKIIMEAASRHLSSITLELGGKSPLIVDEKANLRDTAEKLVWGKFSNAGQTCIAPDYVLCHEKIQNALLEEIRSAILRLFDPDGKGIQKSAAYARIINERHFDRLNDMLNEALDDGALLVSGGQTHREDCYISPTVLTGVDPDGKLSNEEIFGPILPVLSFNTVDDVITYINSKPKPLAMYLFCGGKENRQAIEKNTSAGGICVNETLVHFMHPNLPFGGANHSGIGKSHGHFGFLSLSNEKAVLKQRVGHTSVKLLYPPYTPRVKKMINLLLRYF